MAKKNTDPSKRAPTPPPPAGPARRRQPARRTGNDSVNDPSYEDIAEAAYQRYLSRGGNDGQDFDDWVEAERELRRRNK